ncbi:hypothetical protein [Fischerella sp. PCC 9605]|uniref:hypothetical protein n=1 Tax=Fischerella sp. PCC 9605 TaxID=1173024 RepID=UPI00047EC29E|nr:hypothetical protein [Fischerella sp. PCC 9605]
MASQSQLSGVELIECAKANATTGVAIAAQSCGYGDDIDTFMQELKQACLGIGVEINELRDLITDQQKIRIKGGVEIRPDTSSIL